MGIQSGKSRKSGIHESLQGHLGERLTNPQVVVDGSPATQIAVKHARQDPALEDDDRYTLQNVEHTKELLLTPQIGEDVVPPLLFLRHRHRQLISAR
jgi:hypothetical protein